MADGTVENEMCPVFVATTTAEVHADPDEVDDHVWVDWAEFRSSVLDGTPRRQPLVRRAAPGDAGGPLDRPRSPAPSPAALR